ncbi:MAG TPA: hypothetical protein VGE01_09740 [Fimbriimonas sp.]
MDNLVDRKIARWILAAVVLGPLVGGAVGSLIGLLLGWLAPGYYRSVLVGGREPGFDPVQSGLGLGMTQGVMVGAGLGVLAAFALALLRGAPVDTGAARPRHRIGFLIWSTGVTLALLYLAAYWYLFHASTEPSVRVFLSDGEIRVNSYSHHAVEVLGFVRGTDRALLSEPVLLVSKTGWSGSLESLRWKDDAGMPVSVEPDQSIQAIYRLLRVTSL